MGALHFAKSDFKGQSITLDNFVDRNRPETSLNRLSDSKIFKISYCPYSRLKLKAYTISMTYPRYNILYFVHIHAMHVQPARFSSNYFA